MQSKRFGKVRWLSTTAGWLARLLVLVDGRLVQQRDHIALHYSQFSETMHQIREEEGMNMSAIVFFKNSIFFIYLRVFLKKKIMASACI